MATISNPSVLGADHLMPSSVLLPPSCGPPSSLLSVPTPTLLSSAQTNSQLLTFTQLFEEKKLKENEIIKGIVQESFFPSDQNLTLRILLNDRADDDFGKKGVDSQQKIFVTFSPKFSLYFCFCQPHDVMIIKGPLTLESHMLFDKGEICPHIHIHEAYQVYEMITISLHSTNFKEEIQLQYDKKSNSCTLSSSRDSNNISSHSSSLKKFADKESSSSSSSYTYTNIADLKVDSIVHLWGVVLDYSPPRKSKGTDYVTTLCLADYSLPFISKEVLSINIFNKSLPQLPDIHQKGDIVRFHRLKIQSFQGALQGINAKGFSSIVFDGNENENFSISGNHLDDQNRKIFHESNNQQIKIQSHSPITWEDVLSLKKLKNWWKSYNYFSQLNQKRPFHADNSNYHDAGNIDIELGKRAGFPYLSKRSHLKLINSLTAGVYFDFVGEVIQTVEASCEDQLSLIVTDYTENSRLRPIPLNSNGLHIYLICTLWDNHVLPASKLQPGTFVYLRNVHVRAVPITDDLIAVLHGSSNNGFDSHKHIVVLDETDEDVQQLLLRKDKMMSKRAKLNQSAVASVSNYPKRLITTHLHKNVPLTTLKEVEIFRLCPFLFRLQVFIVGFFPADLKEFSRPFCVTCQKSYSLGQKSTCPICGSEFEWKFMFGLVAIDATGKLPLLCHGKEAVRKTISIGKIDDREYFLHSLKATDLSSDTNTLEQLKQIMVAILSDSNGEDGPLLDLCVKSYYKTMGTGGDDHLKKRYSIFETSLLP